jgi:hypothetical protein
MAVETELHLRLLQVGITIARVSHVAVETLIPGARRSVVHLRLLRYRHDIVVALVTDGSPLGGEHLGIGAGMHTVTLLAVVLRRPVDEFGCFHRLGNLFMTSQAQVIPFRSQQAGMVRRVRIVAATALARLHGTVLVFVLDDVLFVVAPEAKLRLGLGRKQPTHLRAVWIVALEAVLFGGIVKSRARIDRVVAVHAKGRGFSNGEVVLVFLALVALPTFFLDVLPVEIG